ncbi:MAG TPA: hypothetical protein DCZ63_00775 [Geobacter sp.]|nr:hypothetical protein [Geobacter sp.]
MIKSTIVVSIIFLTLLTSPESHAQEPEAVKSASADKNQAAFQAGGHASARTPDRGIAGIPLANLFPTREPAVRDKINPVVAPPPTIPRQESSGLQHEFHGEFTTSFSNSNGVPN